MNQPHPPDEVPEIELMLGAGTNLPPRALRALIGALRRLDAPNRGSVLVPNDDVLIWAKRFGATLVVDIVHIRECELVAGEPVFVCVAEMRGEGWEISAPHWLAQPPSWRRRGRD